MDETSVPDPGANPTSATESATEAGAGIPDERDSGRVQRLTAARQWALWTTAVGGPILYALGRLMADTFYGRFGVAPEEAGLTYASLVLPAALLAAIAAAASVAIVLLGRLAFIAGGVVVFWIAVWFVFESGRDWSDARLVGGALATVGALWLVGRIDDGSAKRASAGVGVLVVLGSLVGGAWFIADRAADRALLGRPTSLSLGPIRLTSAGARLVALDDLDGGPPRRHGCVLLLGSANGVQLIVVDAVVWRVPSSVGQSVGGRCEPADALPEQADLPSGWTVDLRREDLTVEPIWQLWLCGERPLATLHETVTTASRGAGDDARFVEIGVRPAEDPSTPSLAAKVRSSVRSCPEGWDQPIGTPDSGATMSVTDPRVVPSAEPPDVDDIVVWRWETTTRTPGWEDIISSAHTSAVLIDGDISVQIRLWGPGLTVNDVTEIIEAVAPRLARVGAARSP